MTEKEQKYQVQLTDYLSQFVTANKKEKIKKVLAQRMSAVTVVLEDIYKSHNASAVLRTCDCMGVQHIHIIENEHNYRLNTQVLRGSANWLSLHRYREDKKKNTIQCLKGLKEKGFKIYVSSLAPSSTTYTEVTYDQPSALVLGTEYLGVSDEAISMADELIHIPMVGFTESYNVSVSAAMILSDMIPKIKNNMAQWALTESEAQLLTYQWYKAIVKHADRHVGSFLKTLP